MGVYVQGQREAVERHEKEDLSQHLELITQHVAQLQLQSLDIQSQIRVMMVILFIVVLNSLHTHVHICGQHHTIAYKQISSYASCFLKRIFSDLLACIRK